MQATNPLTLRLSHADRHIVPSLLIAPRDPGSSEPSVTVQCSDGFFTRPQVSVQVLARRESVRMESGDRGFTYQGQVRDLAMDGCGIVAVRGTTRSGQHVSAVEEYTFVRVDSQEPVGVVGPRGALVIRLPHRTEQQRLTITIGPGGLARVIPPPGMELIDRPYHCSCSPAPASPFSMEFHLPVRGRSLRSARVIPGSLSLFLWNKGESAWQRVPKQSFNDSLGVITASGANGTYAVFGCFRPRSLLFYDSTRGEGEFYATDGRGGMNPLGAKRAGWRKTWGSIVPGNFGGDGHTDLLFYDSATGEGEFYATDGRGGMTPLGAKHAGWRKSWSLIVPGNFGGNGHTDLLFYDSATGEGEFYATGGRGGMTPLGARYNGWRKTWSLIVPGDFGGDGHTDLLFYDSATGEGEFYATDGRGGMTPLGARYNGWRKTWSLIVPGDFGGDGHTDLLFYDPTRGEGELYATDGRGGMTPLGAKRTGWRRTWRLIVPGEFGD